MPFLQAEGRTQPGDAVNFVHWQRFSELHAWPHVPHFSSIPELLELLATIVTGLARCTAASKNFTILRRKLGSQFGRRFGTIRTDWDKVGPMSTNSDRVSASVRPTPGNSEFDYFGAAFGPGLGRTIGPEGQHRVSVSYTRSVVARPCHGPPGRTRARDRCSPSAPLAR